MSPRNLARVYCLLIALGLALVGTIIGLFSHTEPYHQASGSVQVYISGNADNHYKSYMTLADDPTIYIVSEQKLSPSFNADSLDDGVISLNYLPSTGQDVDVQSTSGTHLKGKGYSVYEITVLGSQASYQTSAFTSSPKVYVSDFWVYGRILIALAILVVLFGLIMPLSTLNIVLYTLGGLVGGPIIFFFFVGHFEGDVGLASWKQALIDNVVTAVICGAIGLAIGFLVGVVQTLRKEYLADLT